jgi:hypothetical protein
MELDLLGLLKQSMPIWPVALSHPHNMLLYVDTNWNWWSIYPAAAKVSETADATKKGR